MTGLARIVLLLLLVIAAAGTGRADSPAAIHGDLDAVRERRLLPAEAGPLVDRGLRLAASATRPAEEWSALAAVAATCRRSPLDEASRGRLSSLKMLARAFHDSRRWSTLFTEAFVPTFDDLPTAAWPAELERYEQDFDLAATAIENGDERLRLDAEWAWGRIRARVELSRGRAWMTSKQIAELRAGLIAIIERFGDLPLPGEADPIAGRTVGDRAREALAEIDAVSIGRPGPATAAPTLDGADLDLADFRGRIVVLDFWTSFCAPCLALVPHTRELLRRFEGEPVVVLGVCGDQDREKGRATARRLAMAWPSFWDGPSGPDGPIARAWHVTGWPSIYVLDADGAIRFRFHSRRDAESGLESALHALLAEG